MLRFGGREIVALAAWLGLAMLGYGPRASAWFQLSTTSVSQTESGGAGSGPNERDATSQLPHVTDAFSLFDAYNFGPQSPGGGGAGSPSSSSSSSAGSTGLLVAGIELTGPSLTTRLRWRESLPIPDPLTAAIFEPPRIGAL